MVSLTCFSSGTPGAVEAREPVPGHLSMPPFFCVTIETSSIYLPKPKTTRRSLAPFLWASASCITECTLGGQRRGVGPYPLNNRPATSETEATGPLSYWNSALFLGQTQPEGLALPQLNDRAITFAPPSEVAGGNTTECGMCFPLSLN